MSVNRSLRRAAEKKSRHQGVSPIKLINSLSNLDGVATLPAKIDEFVAASARMEAIAAQLDSVEDLEEAVSAMKRLADTVQDQLPAIIEGQQRQSEVLRDLVQWLLEKSSDPTLANLLLKLNDKLAEDSDLTVTPSTNEEAHDVQ